MKFLVDAQLPRRLAVMLNAAGHEAIHTLDLPDANRTPDSEIAKRANLEQAVVITKDSDFVNSFLLRREPAKLLLVATGNITNRDLEDLFVKYLPAIVTNLSTHDFVELTSSALILRS